MTAAASINKLNNNNNNTAMKRADARVIKKLQTSVFSLFNPMHLTGTYR